jgi:hypothetical protein
MSDESLNATVGGGSSGSVAVKTQFDQQFNSTNEIKKFKKNKDR